jgi:DNA-binding transcriptional MerR regulator
VLKCKISHNQVNHGEKLMFRIGEFSKLARVSGRQLRHYDQLNLLTPDYIDPQTGYRYYAAQQIPRLNRILSLKELGLSLEQIARLLNENISTDEIRGMLVMKKAQLEQMLHEEIARFRYIESRIEQIDKAGQLEEYGLVLKSIPPQQFISNRHICKSLPEALMVLQEMTQVLPRTIGRKNLGHFTVVSHSDMFDMENLDLEMGFVLFDDYEDEISLSDGSLMIVRELPAVDTMLTVTRLGNPQEGHGCYSSVGFWLEANGYQINGLGREVFIQPPIPGKEDETVTEIQFPVQKIASDALLLS